MIKFFLLTKKMKKKAQRITGASDLSIDTAFGMCGYYADKFGIPEGVVQQIFIDKCNEYQDLKRAKREMVTTLFSLYGQKGLNK